MASARGTDAERPRQEGDERPGRGPGRPRHIEPSAHRQARLADIIETAAAVFRRDGYDAGSLNDVATEMGLRKATLYYYIKSKSELLYLVFDRAISLALERLDDLAHVEDPRQRLGELIRHQVRIVTEEPDMFSVFFDNRPRLDGTYEDQIRAKERRYVRLFAEAVEQAGGSGVIPRVDGRLGAQALLGMTSWTYHWFDQSRDDAELVANTFVRLLIG